ncbi:MAG: hypothetical protein ACRDTE_07660 [Pseudonocardiaceae bacterium]
METWPLEGVITALERGGLSHRRRLAAAIKADPWGPVARNVLEALSVTEPYGVTPLMESVIVHAREHAADDEPEQVAREVSSLISSSGLTAAEFAARLGTSPSRLSTYRFRQGVPVCGAHGAHAPGDGPHERCEHERQSPRVIPRETVTLAKGRCCPISIAITHRARAWSLAVISNGAATQSRSVPGRKDPAERAQDWFLAPAVSAASAPDRTHALNEPSDQCKQDIDRRDTEQDTLHDRRIARSSAA